MESLKFVSKCKIWQVFIQHTSIICECKIVATEFIMESTHGLLMVVEMYMEPIEEERRSEQTPWFSLWMEISWSTAYC